MTRRYYSSRTNPNRLSLEDLYRRLKSLYLLLQGRDFFKEKAGITDTWLPDAIKFEAELALGFQPFPLTKWPTEVVTEDHIFDALEFLYDRVSEPGPLVGMISDTGWNYEDYGSYDEAAGKEEFRRRANAFLSDYKTGFELSKDGLILALGTHGLQHILEALIPAYDEENVDRRVRDAIAKWRNRSLSMPQKREAIRELSDVFEWLKKSKKLAAVLDRKDESAIFEIANNFAIRHHNPQQKGNYDQDIWYSWMFHFYLATYHACVRLLIRKEAAADRTKKRRN
jgi:hypothetical protein